MTRWIFCSDTDGICRLLPTIVAPWRGWTPVSSLPLSWGMHRSYPIHAWPVLIRLTYLILYSMYRMTPSILRRCALRVLSLTCRWGGPQRWHRVKLSHRWGRFVSTWIYASVDYMPLHINCLGVFESCHNILHHAYVGNLGSTIAFFIWMS